MKKSSKLGQILVGIDEAGRGPIAGPVAVGLVLCVGELPHELQLDRDSKKLSPKAREQWFCKIKDYAKLGIIQYSCTLIPASHIDEQGIVKSIALGVTKNLKKLKVPSNATILLDGGLRAPEIFTDQTTIIKGDEKESIIALASVVAKVTRDEYMKKLTVKYPQYYFDIHKGYGTKKHYMAIKKAGLSTEHRKSFLTRIFM